LFMEHKLIYYGHDTLTEVAKEVETFDSSLVELTNEMLHLMKRANGVGLAAPQINISRRIIVVDLSHNESGPKIAIINPQIISESKKLVSYEEGCLSVPGIYEEIMRPADVKVKGYSPDGKKLEFKADAFFARVIQHEIDHLDGILFIDRLEEFIRKEYTKELKKIRKMNG
jgi:peptide deformylase